jgi:hypothetical protein
MIQVLKITVFITNLIFYSLIFLNIFFSIGHMILLGSIQRSELVELIERHICHERRVKVAAEWEMATHSL